MKKTETTNSEPVNVSISTSTGIQCRQEDRQKIDSDVQAFLSRGGRIEVVDPGVTGEAWKGYGKTRLTRSQKRQLEKQKRG